MTARQQRSVAASADHWPLPAKPSVLVFDVNETLDRLRIHDSALRAGVR